MAQFRRVVAVGTPHHITQRGNARQDVFVTDSLCRVYLNLLPEHAAANQLRILAYALMTNHLHLVVVPETETSRGHALRHAHRRFSQYWNAEFGRTGYAWQNRYYSCPVAESAVAQVIAYVENNPVRARMLARAGDYAWSSAAAHLGGADHTEMLDLSWWADRWNPAGGSSSKC